MKSPLNNLIAQWNRVGAAFTGPMAKRTPDLERMLLDTARLAAKNSRLFTMAATWLGKYGPYVAKDRLKQLTTHELDSEYRPYLGLLLETVQQFDRSTRFNKTISRCSPCANPRPLFDIYLKNQTLRHLAQKNATALSRHWGLWSPEMTMKFDTLRSTNWILENNPKLFFRAVYKGNLRASILAELLHNHGQCESESQLARRCGVTISGLLDAICDLELAGLIKRTLEGRKNKLQLIGQPVRKRPAA